MQNKKKIIEHHWYQSHLTWLTLLLLPFSGLFRVLVAIRFFLYRIHLLKKTNYPVPVIVVGNLTVGGTGKTPFVIWLADYLQKKGYRPGIVSRGVGGKKWMAPYWVDRDAAASEVGDEALLLARKTHCPMVVCVHRVLAVNELLEKTNCNVVLSDDGLQHYSMGRKIEIAVVDSKRQFGNGLMLPAGPLREPLKRLNTVDLVVANGSVEKGEQMVLEGDTVHSLLAPDKKMALSAFKNQTVHAIAAIGHPERFFSSLRKNGIQLIEHIFPDHYLYEQDDIYFPDNLPVIMTEKDAVKCMAFADQRHWCLPVEAHMSPGVSAKISSLLEAG